MKTLLTLCGVAILSSLLSISAKAELRVPSSVFTIDELEEAKTKAVETEKPLIFVYTDPGST